MAGAEVSSDLSSNDEAQLDYWQLEMARASLLWSLVASGSLHGNGIVPSSLKRKSEKEKSTCLDILQAFACILSATIPLTKANHMVQK